ncbi:50S ribosomal protein L4 [bacterium]|nr:50S ribosomal protein L4 [bacterium]
MEKVQMYNPTGKKIKDINAPKEVLSYPYKQHLIYEALVNFQTNQRRGTASTKARGEVRGGGQKPWRQKGTGRARTGSIRSPIFKGGGITFGPKPKDYSYRIPKKAKRNALKSALSKKFADKNLFVVDKLTLDKPKTKNGIKILEALKVESALIVDTHENKNLFLSLRNVPKVKTIDYNQLNLYDVLRYKWLILSENAFGLLMEKLK